MAVIGKLLKKKKSHKQNQISSSVYTGALLSGFVFFLKKKV